MQTASSARLPDGFMAAIWLGAEKPHQGVSTRNQAWHPAPNVCNSTTALGLRASTALNRVRSFCSGEQFDSDLGLYYLRARYYNPATGRFLSRDPLDGKTIDPASLHKYLYAGGDPVNMIDPTGKSIVENVFNWGKSIVASVVEAKWTVTRVLCVLTAAALLLHSATHFAEDAANGGWTGTFYILAGLTCIDAGRMP